MHLYYNFAVIIGSICVGEVGGFEAGSPDSVEPTLKYHPYCAADLTWVRNPDRRHCVVGSLTGAVASQKVTEARKGPLRLIGNQPSSAKA